MNRLRSPIVVTPPPPRVPRLIVTNSRKMLPRADDEARPLAAVLQVLRRQADRRHTGRSAVSSPIVGPAVDDRPTRRSGSSLPMRTCGPIDGVRPDDGAGADLARSDARAPSDRLLPRPASIAKQQLGLRHDLAVDVRRAPCACASATARGPSVTSSRSRSPGTTCRRNLASSTPRSARRAPSSGAVSAIEHQHRRHLRQRLDHQHGRHQRRAREVSLEEFFVDGDVLDRHEPPARLVLGDRVDEKRRIAVVNASEERRKVEGHAHMPLPGCWTSRLLGRQRVRRTPELTDPGAWSVLRAWRLGAWRIELLNHFGRRCRARSRPTPDRRPRPLKTNCRPFSRRDLLQHRLSCAGIPAAASAAAPGLPAARPA